MTQTITGMEKLYSDMTYTENILPKVYYTTDVNCIELNGVDY